MGTNIDKGHPRLEKLLDESHDGKVIVAVGCDGVANYVRPYDANLHSIAESGVRRNAAIQIGSHLAQEPVRLSGSHYPS